MSLCIRWIYSSQTSTAGTWTGGDKQSEALSSQQVKAEPMIPHEEIYAIDSMATDPSHGPIDLFIASPWGNGWERKARTMNHHQGGGSEAPARRVEKCQSDEASRSM